VGEPVGELVRVDLPQRQRSKNLLMTNSHRSVTINLLIQRAIVIIQRAVLIIDIMIMIHVETAAHGGVRAAGHKEAEQSCKTWTSKFNDSPDACGFRICSPDACGFRPLSPRKLITGPGILATVL
jgi:hypothetical protein